MNHFTKTTSRGWMFKAVQWKVIPSTNLVRSALHPDGIVMTLYGAKQNTFISSIFSGSGTTHVSVTLSCTQV